MREKDNDLSAGLTGQVAAELAETEPRLNTGESVEVTITRTVNKLVDGHDAAFWRESYVLLRDAVCEHLEPCDDDVAEEAILIKAIELAGKRLRDNRRHILGEAQDAIRDNCGMCDGYGFTIETTTGSTAEHHPSCDGNCTHLCPVEVPIQQTRASAVRVLRASDR